MLNIIRVSHLTVIVILSMCINCTVVYAEDYKLYQRYGNNTQYDLFFHKYGKQLFGVAFDWRNFKAQAIAESKLTTDAKSYVGAEGIMQIMPGTFDEIKRRNKFVKGSVMDPKVNIRAGVWYDKDIWKIQNR